MMKIIRGGGGGNQSVSGKNVQIVKQLIGLPGLQLIQQSSQKVFTSAVYFPMYKPSTREFKQKSSLAFEMFQFLRWSYALARSTNMDNNQDQ